MSREARATRLPAKRFAKTKPPFSIRPTIYAYNNYRLYLGDLYHHLKTKLRSFSFRSFSEEAGFSSPNFLKLVIDGKRNVSPHGIEKFVHGLHLGGDEAEYFENLVFFGQAETLAEKNRYYERMSRHRSFRQIRGLDRDQFEYFSKWYYPAIRELIGTRRFRNDPAWIAQALNPPIPVQAATRAIGLLLSLRLIERLPDGALRQMDPIVSSGAEIRSLVVRNYHGEMIQKSLRALDLSPANERDISSVTLSIPESLISDLKERIACFRRELLTTIGKSTTPADQVYQLNIQLFPLTRKLNEGNA